MNRTDKKPALRPTEAHDDVAQAIKEGVAEDYSDYTYSKGKKPSQEERDKQEPLPEDYTPISVRV